MLQMLLPFTKIILITIITLSVCSSCSKELEQAETSVEGEWKVVKIISIYDKGTTTAAEKVEETGDLGSFTFSENTVDFTFTRNDTTFTGNTPWDLILEKVQAGFAIESRYTLDLEDEFIFDVEFGDNTRNAEEDATSITFYDESNESFATSIELELEKQ